MQCPRCHAQNREGRRFCFKCGAALARSCPACGFSNEPDDEFCGGCGASLRASPAPVPVTGPERPIAPYTPKHLAEKILRGRSALEGERRQVTVLFADMAGFTSLAERRDPEEVHQIIDRCFDLITAEVHRLEGTINQYTGDGVMALFGAPIAHEDGPRRAVHAALGIQRAIRDYSKPLEREKGLTLQMRIGINSGPVVVGRIGDDLRMDYTAVGDTTNLAARLQQTARPGSVLVSEATHKLIAGYFDALDLGEQPVKGRAPARAFEVLRPRGRRTRLDVATERGLTPLVGRDRERQILVDRFAEVKRGRGQVVFIAGEAGIGKSRLILEFRRRLAQMEEPATWLEGRCVSFGQSIPFLPLIEQFRGNFRIEEFDGEPEIIAKVEHGLRRMGELEAQIPFIRYLLSVDPGDPALAALEAPLRRKRMLDAARAVAVRGARIRPIVFVFEDLHWIDTSTEEYLASFMDSVASVPIMLLLTYRVGYAPPLGSRSFHTTLTLHSLSEAETVTMAGHVLGTEWFPPELKAALLEKAEGVPLFVEEVAKTLLDLGILRREGDRYRMVKETADVSVPDTIQAIIMARLDRLGEGGKRTVQLASVIGRQFLRRLLERISELPGKLEGLLGELKALEIIYEQGLLPEPAYIFKHAVIQDVAYNSLLRERRKELHRSVGYAIEELYSDRLADHYEELTYHFTHGEEWGKAMEYGTIAGGRASERFANAEAAKHYAQALHAAGRMAPGPSPETLASLYVKHASALTLLADYEAALAEYEKARELARRTSNRKQETDILMGLALAYSFYHKTEPALQAVDQALSIAREIDDRSCQASCLVTRAEAIASGNGEIVQAAANIEEAIRLSEAVANPLLRARVLVFTGRIVQWQGEFDRAIAVLREGIELARREHSGFLFGLGLFTLGHAHLARGDYEEARRCYHELRSYAEGAGDKLYIVRVPNCIGGVHLELYDLDEAIRLNEEGDDVTKRLWRWPEPRGHSLVKLGLAHLYRGDHGHAQEAFGRAWELLEDDPWARWRWHIPLLAARGELAFAEHRLDEAWTFAGQSLELATQSDARKHVVRAQRLQGQVLQARGSLEEAAGVLKASVQLAETIKTPRDAWLGRAALGQVFHEMGQDKAAEAELGAAARTIETITEGLTTPSLRGSFLSAEPVAEVYRMLGRRPPHIAMDTRGSGS